MKRTSSYPQLLAVTLLVVFALAVMSGCGGSDDEEKQFSTKTYPFSFTYPEGWTVSRSAEFTFGTSGDDERSVSVALKLPFDQVTISQYKLSTTLKPGENADQAQVDRVVRRLTRRAKGSRSDGTTVEYGGLKGYQYTVEFPGQGDTTLTNRLTFLFSGDDEFLINCQSSPEMADALDAGCDQILDSLKFDL